MRKQWNFINSFALNRKETKADHRAASESADLREFAGLIMAVERNEEYLRKENQELIEQWRCAFPLLNSYTTQK